MKTLMIVLTAVISLSVVHEAKLADDNLEHGQACAQSVIRIEHSFVASDGVSAYRVREFGLGTTVTPNLILTHNHFDMASEPRPGETLTLFDSAGIAAPLPDHAGFVPLDEGTALIYLPNTASLPATAISDHSVVEHLATGDRLTVCYWDKARERVAQQDFEIILIENGVATLADPERVINPGDSGGGAFFEGRLVGNTWSVYANRDGKLTGAFNVALLPAQVQSAPETTEPETSNSAQ